MLAHLSNHSTKSTKSHCQMEYFRPKTFSLAQCKFSVWILYIAFHPQYKISMLFFLILKTMLIHCQMEHFRFNYFHSVCRNCQNCVYSIPSTLKNLNAVFFIDQTVFIQWQMERSGFVLSVGWCLNGPVDLSDSWRTWRALDWVTFTVFVVHKPFHLKSEKLVARDRSRKTIMKNEQTFHWERAMSVSQK
jgi:hypothetical protein